MCVDYTNLNKACKNYPFILSRIDKVMDTTVGYILLSFLDCYLDYHQILIKKGIRSRHLSCTLMM
jgi:hypothetical protein